MRHLFGRFAADRRGNVLMLFGLSVVPLMALAGGALEYAMATYRQLELQIAVDAATMAAAKDPPVDQAVLKANIDKAIDARLQAAGIDHAEWTLLSAQDVNGRVSAQAELAMPTTFLRILNYNQFVLGTRTEVARSETKLEVALVLDNTGSMSSNNKIGTLRDAATTLIDTLYGTQNASNMIKVALVPFVTAVNIKVPGVFDWAWMDTTAAATYHGVNFNLTGGARTNHFTLFDQLYNKTDKSGWKGCVEARAEPYDVDDTPPNAATPDTLHVPWFWPDEPDPKNSSGNTISYVDGTSYNNNYMPDDYTVPSGTQNKNTAAARQKNTSKYLNQRNNKIIDETPSDTSGPNKSCPEPLTPLTNDADTMRTKIGNMRPWNNSGTNIAQGMVWGWSVLSPEPPFTEGVAWDDKKTQKAMIVLTDGVNEVYGGWDNHNKSDYSAYNYLAKNRLGTTDKDDGVGAVNGKVTTLCTKIKGKGIRLYTITFQLNSAGPQTMFRECATKPEMYYNSPSTAELKGIFKAIATDLGNLRFTE